MIKISQAVSGMSDFVKAKIYPVLSGADRMKVSAALFTAQWAPDKIVTLILLYLFPDVPVEKSLATAVTLGILDGDGNIDVDMLLELAKSHIREFGDLNVSLLGIEFTLSETNITALGDCIRSKV